MNKDEDCICFYRDAVIAGPDDPAAVTMCRFNLSRDYTVRLLNEAIAPMRSSRYLQLESSAVEDASGLGRLGDPMAFKRNQQEPIQCFFRSVLDGRYANGGKHSRRKRF